MIVCGGPDRINGDFHRSTDPSRLARPYDPTNGTVSRGDIWRGERVVYSDHWSNERGPWPITTLF